MHDFNRLFQNIPLLQRDLHREGNFHLPEAEPFSVMFSPPLKNNKTSRPQSQWPPISLPAGPASCSRASKNIKSELCKTLTQPIMSSLVNIQQIVNKPDSPERSREQLSSVNWTNRKQQSKDCKLCKVIVFLLLSLYTRTLLNPTVECRVFWLKKSLVSLSTLSFSLYCRLCVIWLLTSLS